MNRALAAIRFQVVASELAVILTMEHYLSDAEKFARQLLKGYRSENPESGASGYRILDTCSQRLKASGI
jgi:hypothetical protein